MRFRVVFTTFIFILLLLYTAKPVLAIENPFSSFNNKFGMHILFPEELPEAAQLVNSSGGDWGYVLIPIQAGDKDIVKWQAFMDAAKQHHVIPIIRLATEGDYFNTKVWRKPKETDIVDFANFLNSLEWPVKNRYIIVFNEVNRGDEWGGSVNAKEYAELLAYTVNVFKAKHQDFYIISAGMDNAAPNQLPNYQNQYEYLRLMNEAVPGIFNQIDGLSSHSYPNPAFSQPPTLSSRTGIDSFAYERALVKSMSDKELPIFITETGWSAKRVSDEKRAEYYIHAFNNAWTDLGIVTVTPFIFRASGPFGEFSFFKENGEPTQQYIIYKDMPKQRGIPVLSKKSPQLLTPHRSVLGITDSAGTNDKSSYKSFENEKILESRFSLTNLSMAAILWLIGS